MGIEELLRVMIERGASDLHLSVPSPPILRIDGCLANLDGLPNLIPEDVEQALIRVTTKGQQEIFERERELDFAYSVPGLGRFRVNASLQRDTPKLSFRLIQAKAPGIEELGLPEACKTLAMKEHGLVVVTGPTGSGKSTTLAAMIEYLNNRERRHIITIEDPIEFQYENKKCLISQREVGTDTLSFATAVKHALRQDPDVILVGEMRDLETVAAALTAAEMGQLVLATLHAPSAPQAIDRIIDLFPPHHQQQARVQLAITLEGVLYQTLLPRIDGQGRVVAVEVMLVNSAIRNLIREVKTHQMETVIQTSSQLGMQTMDQALLNLCYKGLINHEQALIRSRNPAEFKKMLLRPRTGSITP